MPTAEEIKAAETIDEFNRRLSEVEQVGQSTEQGVKALREGFTAVQQSVEAMQRTQSSNREWADDREQRVYIEDTHKAVAPQAYAEVDGRTVRMCGHLVRKGDHVWREHGLLDDPHPINEAHHALQRAFDNRRLVREVLHKATGGRSVHTPRMDRAVQRAALGMGGTIAAVVGKIFADGANIGAEFMPEAVAPSYEREVLAAPGLISLIEQRDHPGGSLKLPYKSGFLQVHKHNPPSANDPNNDTLTDWGTGEASVEPIDSVIATQLDRNALEDSVIAVLPDLQADMVEAYSWFFDGSLIHGDTLGTQDVIASWDPRGRIATKTANIHPFTRWDGARKKAIAASADVDLGAAQTYAGLVSVYNALGYSQRMNAHRNPGTPTVAGVLSPEWFFSTGMHLTEFKEYDKIGALTSLVTGSMGPNPRRLPYQVGTLMGHVPVVLNDVMTPDLNASGVYDNVTTTKSGFVVLDLTRWQHWVRKGMMVERDVEVRNNTVTIVSRMRGNVRTKRLGSGQTAAAFGYDLSAA